MKKTTESSLVKYLTLSLGLAVSGLSTQSAHASGWTGGANSNWDNLSNWDSNPSGGVGEVDTLTNFPVITANNSLVPNDLKIAAANPNSTGRMDIRSGTFTNNYWTFIGDWAGTATLNIADTTTGGGTYTGFGTGSGSIVSANAASNANFLVGLYNSTGVVNMNTTGHLDTQNLFIAPNSPSGAGTFNLDAGTVNLSGALQVGSDFWGSGGSDGTLNMSGGTVNVGGMLHLGRYNNTISTGTSTVNMTGGTMNVENDVLVGFAGLAGTKSIVNIANSATLNVGSTSSRWVSLAQWDNTDVTMNVSNGGVLNLNAGTDIQFAIGNNSGTRVLNVDNGTLNGTAGGGSYINMNNNSTAGTSTINIKNGGVVRVDAIVGAASSTLNFDNGTLKATANDAYFIGDVFTTNIKAGGAILDTNGFNPTVRGNLLAGDGLGGGVTKNGLGTLTMLGVNTYTGATNVNVGTLKIGPSGSISASTNVNIADAATFDTTAQSFTMLGTQTFKFTLNPAGAGSAGMLNAASLDVTAGVADFSTLGTLDDSAYVIANYTSKTGPAFATVTNLPTGYAIDYGYNSGTQVAVIAVPEPGTWAMLVGGLGMLATLQRSRRRMAK